LDRRWREKLRACHDDITEMRIGLERIGDARSSLGHATKRRHFGGSNGPTLILEIKRVPQTAVGCLWLCQIVVTKSERQREVTPHPPFILNISGPGCIFELHWTTVRHRQLCVEVVRQAQEC